MDLLKGVTEGVDGRKGTARLKTAGRLTIGMSALVALLSPDPPAVWLGLPGFLLFAVLYEISLQRRNPAASWFLLAESIAGLLLLALYPRTTSPVYLLFVTASGCLIHLPLRRALAALLSLWVAMGLVWRLAGATWPQTLLAEAETAAGFFFVAAFTLALAQTDRERLRSQDLLARLREAHDALQAQGELEKELAVAEERTRLAREIHDSLGHHLTALGLQLETALREEEPVARTRIQRARELAHEALVEVRRSVQALRPSGLEGRGLLSAIRQLVADTREETALPVRLLLPDLLPALDLERQVTLYRAVEEALTNIRRHARAEGIWIRLFPRRGRVTLLVFDRDPAVTVAASRFAGGFGLRGLRERADRLSGHLAALALPGRGFMLRVTLPLSPPSRERAEGRGLP